MIRILIRIKLFVFTILFIFSCLKGQENFRETTAIAEHGKFQLDGEANEWDEIHFRKLYSDPLGNFPSPTDLKAEFKIAWKDSNLVFLFNIFDDMLTSDTVSPWKGDAVEIFISDRKGSDNSIQYSIVTGEKGKIKARVKIEDRRKFRDNGWNEPVIENFIIHEKNCITLEVKLNYNIFGQDPDKNNLAVQVYVDDNDTGSDNKRNQLTWYHYGHSYLNTFSYYDILLKKEEDSNIDGTSRIVITDNEKIEAYIFGAVEKDKITVKNNTGLAMDFQAGSALDYLPDTINLQGFVTDIENDTIHFFLNGKFISSIDLYFAPRIYENLEKPRFEREIRIFKAKDRLEMPDSGGVLFIGSSSIRMWESVFEDFPELSVVHRGFGGSVSSDVLQYADAIVLPYKPSAIVYYEGDNDIPHGLTTAEIINNMKEFIQIARSDNENTKIYLISPKPAIVRMHLWEKYLELHGEMKLLAEEYSNVQYVDVTSSMFLENGALNEDIFIEDGLHLNQKGYKLWKKILRNEMKLNDSE